MDRDDSSQDLRAVDPQVFYRADSAAETLGISTREIRFSKVRSEPLKSNSWFRLLQQTKEDQIEEVLSFAAKALPLSQIASGPSKSLGLGEKYRAHQAINWILQGLKRFPRTRLAILGTWAAESRHQE